MIDIMCLCQSYKCKKIIEVKWINSDSNFINLIIKNKASTAFKKLINTNYLELQAIEWVKKKSLIQKET